MFRAKTYPPPQKNIFYTDNISASVTKCMSACRCHVSPVKGHLSHDQTVELVCGGSVINGAYPVQFFCHQETMAVNSFSSCGSIEKLSGNRAKIKLNQNQVELNIHWENVHVVSVKTVQSLYLLSLQHIHCICQLFFIDENLFKKNKKKNSILKYYGI